MQKKIWAENNKNKIKECQRHYDIVNRDRENTRKRKWIMENPDKMQKCRKNWIKSHPEKHREYSARHKAIKLSAPGRGITAEQEREIFEEYNYHCVYCGRSDLPLTIDHIKPLSKGGAHDISNATAACKPCNSKKRNKTLLRFLYDRHKMETRNNV
jgi:5-methylcytosine-specific restriction endonuclease McrA